MDDALMALLHLIILIAVLTLTGTASLHTAPMVELAKFMVFSSLFAPVLCGDSQSEIKEHSISHKFSNRAHALTAWRAAREVGVSANTHQNCDNDSVAWEPPPLGGSVFAMTPAIECNIWHRFDVFVDTVCRQCAHALAECGCKRGEDNPAVRTLWEYTENIIATMQAATIHNQQAWVPRVIVHVSGGLGNQIFSIVNALIIAIHSRRALVVVKTGKQMYELDPVFDVTSLLQHRKCSTFSTMGFSSFESYEDMVHERFHSEEMAEIECVQLEEATEDPYSLFANPHGRYACIYIQMNVHTHIHVGVHVYVDTYTQAQTDSHTLINTNKQTYAHANTHVRAHTSHVHTHAHTNTHTQAH